MTRRSAAQAEADAESDAVVNERAHGRTDAEGFVSKLSLWNTCGINAYGAVARSARMIDNAETLLGGPSHTCASTGEPAECYHYHTKVMIKEAGVGGAWEWHQDYGYWYNNGCMAPQMLSAMVALNGHTEENGCLRVLKGSHALGRLPHALTGGQAGADPERVEQARLRGHEEVAVRLQPGHVLFFHCNLLHASARNRSAGPRWSMITAYNARANNPFREHHHPCYAPLDRWDDGAVLALKTLGKEPWTSDLATHAGYSEAALMPCVRESNRLHKAAGGAKLQAVRKKYSQEQHGAVSSYTPVDL